MAEVEARETQMQIEAEGRGFGIFRPTATGEERLSPEEAAKFEPGGRWKDILPWIGGPVGMAAEQFGGVRSDWAEAGRLEKMSPADRDRELQRIRTDDGEERYQWMAKRMSGTHARELTDAELAQEINQAESQRQKQARRDADAQAEAQRQNPGLWPQPPTPPTGVPQTPVQFNIYANDRDSLKRMVDDGIERALPAY